MKNKPLLHSREEIERIINEIKKGYYEEAHFRPLGQSPSKYFNKFEKTRVNL